MDRVALKTAAKAQIKGKIGILFVITLIIAVISGVAALIGNLIPFCRSFSSHYYCYTGICFKYLTRLLKSFCW